MLCAEIKRLGGQSRSSTRIENSNGSSGCDRLLVFHQKIYVHPLTMFYVRLLVYSPLTLLNPEIEGEILLTSISPLRYARYNFPSLNLYFSTCHFIFSLSLLFSVRLISLLLYKHLYIYILIYIKIYNFSNL